MKILGKFIQFSKVMVVLVVGAVTALYTFSIVGMMYDGELSMIPATLKNYADFAAVVFVAYSGNSALEKWIVKQPVASVSDEEGVG